jgi:PAS domain S-box-containing protein
LVRDITDRIQAEEKYTTVIRNLQDGFCILDAEGRYLEVNETYTRILGRSREELLLMTVLDVWEPATREELARHVQKALQEGTDKFLSRHIRPDGSPVDVDVTMQRLDGDRLFVFARDVTDRRRDEEQRLETLQRLELLADATSDGIWDADLATDRLWHNEAYLTAFGYPPDESGVSRQWWQERVHPQDRPEVVAGLDQVLQSDQDRWSAGRAHEKEPLSETLERFRLLRRTQIRLFRNASAQDFERTGLHPERGELTLREQLETLAGHDLNHLAQIQRLTAPDKPAR